MESCCICGRSLPNSYAIAGRCGADACSEPFCSHHWRNGNHRCREHGADERPPPGDAPGGGMSDEETPVATPDLASPDADTPDAAAPQPQPAASKRLTGKRAKAVMKATIDFTAKLGAGAGTLIRSLRKDNSPDAMIGTLDERLEVLQPRREEAAARLEDLYTTIVTKKRSCAKAPGARKRILESELKSLLAGYKALERQLNVLLENERNLNLVKSRLNETIAYAMAGIDEDTIDRVSEGVDDAADEAEARTDAIRDLERAGRRREHDDDSEDLWGELAGFEDDGITTEDEDAPEGIAPGSREDPAAADDDDPELALPENDQ